jgi:hypothetical protein
MDGSAVFIILIVVGFVFAMLGAYVATAKHRSVAEGLFLGFLFGPLGVLIIACLPVGTADVDPSAAAQDDEWQRMMARVEARQAEVEAQRVAAEAEEKEARRALFAQRQAEQAARRAERDKAYRAMGIEPGPLAWFKAMSDLGQAVVMGLAIGIPARAILVLIAIVFLRS